MKRYVLMDGEVKASLLAAWLESVDGKQIALAIDEETLKAVYHKKARLVLEVK